MIRTGLKQSIRYGMLLCAFWLTAVASFGFVTCVSDDGNTEIQAHLHTLVHSPCGAAGQTEPVDHFSFEHEHHSCRHECEHITFTCIVGQPVKFSACSCGSHTHICQVHAFSDQVYFKPALQIIHSPHYRTNPLLLQLSATILRI